MYQSLHSCALFHSPLLLQTDHKRFSIPLLDLKPIIGTGPYLYTVFEPLDGSQDPFLQEQTMSSTELESRPETSVVLHKRGPTGVIVCPISYLERQ